MDAQERLLPIVFRVRDAYFKWDSFKLVEQEVKQFVESADQEQCEVFQAQIVEELLTSQRAVTFPVRSEHKQSFLKKFILTIERCCRNVEVAHQLYESALATASGDDLAYKTYFLEGEDDGVVLSLAERHELVASGSTGLRTWPAAHYLTRWLQRHPQWIEGKTVLELGSGLGYLGISLLKTKRKPRRVIMTDYHEQVLKLLRHNCESNDLDKDAYDVAELDWEKSPSEALEKTRPDLVIASDVVFDPSLLPALARTIKTFLGTSAKEALVACTLRVEETVLQFAAQLELQGLRVVDVADPDLCAAEDRIVLYSVQKTEK